MANELKYAEWTLIIEEIVQLSWKQLKVTNKINSLARILLLLLPTSLCGYQESLESFIWLYIIVMIYHKDIDLFFFFLTEMSTNNSFPQCLGITMWLELSKMSPWRGMF